MKLLILINMVAAWNADPVIADFSERRSTEGWRIVDDVVMGGRSDGKFSINRAGNAVFQGRVSLENNGGFSSVQYSFPKKDVKEYRFFKIRLKGDGKRYQYRVRSNRSERHAYAYYFQTSGKWQTVSVPMEEMFATWRGTKLDLSNYPGMDLSEIAFLIGNERNEEFRLEIDCIKLVP